MKPKRIQRKRTKGWRMPPNTVYVGRGSKWGNPFLGDKAVYYFRQWLLSGHIYRDQVDMLPIGLFYKNSRPSIEDRRVLLRDLHELKGKDLACWCPLDKPCHADVLLELANTEGDDED